jgi:hypothetical protein
MPVKVGQIEVNASLRADMASKTPADPAKRNDMGGTGRKSEPPKQQDNDNQEKPKSAPIEDDDREDGDIATPKRDRSGNDDEPL